MHLSIAILAGLGSLFLQHPPEKPVRKPLPSQEEIAKLPADGGAEFNRLVFSSSPYLLQHARNPVDWYPWGPEAFEAAAKQDKPVFLSIGYSTCHWCHVMEHESFEDEEVAKKMNAAFINIKVDREERPDVDHVYMQFTLAMNEGNGGWPMTVLMTSEKKPFFAGTYYPKDSRGGRPGMLQLIPWIEGVWKDDREGLLKKSEDLIKFVEEQQHVHGEVELGLPQLRLARNGFISALDTTNGGFNFGGDNKFPTPHNLRFLLREYQKADDKQDPRVQKTLSAVELTLQGMRRGGLWDHVGYGFHRYSTDNEWLLPHFEKMLYDQALISMAYLEAWQVTGNEDYIQTVEEIFEYVLRDMTDPLGGVYSAEDADSEGVEGKFYVWTPEQLEAVLGEEDATFFAELFGFEKGGNFRDQASGQKARENIPHLNATLKGIAAGKEDLAGFLARVEALRVRVFEAREKRIHPFKDDKVLTDWNGLMIAAMAKAGHARSRDDWTQAAERAADFALRELRDPETGHLYKRYRAGTAGLDGLLEDYAFLAWGLIELFENTQDPARLRSALRLVDIAIEDFWDEHHGGFFMTPKGGETLVLRPQETADGAIPSGNSVMLHNLCRLARMTGRTDLEERADAMVKGLGAYVARGAMGHTHFLMAVDFQRGPTQEVVIVGDPEDTATQALLGELRKPFLPQVVWLLRSPGDETALTKLAPFTQALSMVDGKPAAYVCTNFACQAPVIDPAALRASLTGQGFPGEGAADDR